MTDTFHSEYGRIKSLLLKHSKAAFINNVRIEEQWKELNFTEKPDFQKAVYEYSEFESILKLHCDEIFYLPEDNNLSMDSIYCRDASIATNEGMILCNMGKAARKKEPEALRTLFEQCCIKIAGEIKFPGTLEGGDVAWLDEHTLAVGHSYRTNESGIAQLADLLKPVQVGLMIVALPHYKGPSDVFHLMSVFSPVDKDLAVVYSPLMPVLFRNNLLERGFKLIEVPESEFDSMGCNVLALAPRVCMMVKGNPNTKFQLQEAGCKVFEYNGSEISVKGGGGPTCLTRPMCRVV